MRDVERKIDDAALQKHKGTMIHASLVLTQVKKTKGKVYSVLAPPTGTHREGVVLQALRVLGQDQSGNNDLGWLSLLVRCPCRFDTHPNCPGSALYNWPSQIVASEKVFLAGNT